MNFASQIIRLVIALIGLSLVIIGGKKLNEHITIAGQIIAAIVVFSFCFTGFPG